MVVFAFDEHKDNTKRGKCQKFIRARKRDQMIRSRRTQTPFHPGASRPGRQLRSASPHPGGSGGSFRRTAVRGAVLGETASVLLLAVLLLPPLLVRLPALLRALLEPTEALMKLELAGDYTSRLAMLEELKSYPFAAVWDYYCEAMGVPVREAWLSEIKDYEREVQFKRG